MASSVGETGVVMLGLVTGCASNFVLACHLVTNTLTTCRGCGKIDIQVR